MGSKRFSFLIEGTADAAFAVDEAGRITAWNSVAAELFGVSEHDALTVQCHQILPCSNDNQAFSLEQCVITQAAQNNLPLANFDLRLQTKAGKQWCNLSRLIASDPVSGRRQTLYIVRPCELSKRLEEVFGEFVRTYGRNGSNGASKVPPFVEAPINVRLTTREVEVLRSLAKGHSTRTIANELNISAATVNNHIKHILTKLDAHTRLEAIRHAESVGII